ncbi:MAG: hypothetical protein H3C31_01920 [Brumimicrobium sp.]|nr:hypothetical protein [Brumimicrobium sp.]
MKYFLGLLFLISLFSCDLEKKEQPLDKLEIEDDIKSSEDNFRAFENELEFAQFCVQQIIAGNYNSLNDYMDEKGILFSPYAYIDVETAQQFDKERFNQSNEKMFWGYADGSGDSIVSTLDEFIKKHVSWLNLKDPKLKINVYKDKPKTYGSELHNVQEIFPNNTYVEFYLPPSQEGYFDWNALIVVVDKENSNYLLKAILHNQWTI